MLEILEKYHKDGLLHKQTHPTLDLTIWNYSPKVQYERLWDDITIQSRGLVTNSKGEIVARPFKKFFNYEEHEPKDLPNYTSEDPFVCLDFQKKVERDCWEVAGKTQQVPAQRMIDFIERKISKDFPKTSYQPGIVSVDLNTVLPPMISKRLRKAFSVYGKKMKGYYTNQAILHAPESRTSSPISIPRNLETLEHVNVKGLYPCGEGAGYAGGIISAAIDGINCVDAISTKLTNS